MDREFFLRIREQVVEFCVDCVDKVEAITEKTYEKTSVSQMVNDLLIAIRDDKEARTFISKELMKSKLAEDLDLNRFKINYMVKKLKRFKGENVFRGIVHEYSEKLVSAVGENVISNLTPSEAKPKAKKRAKKSTTTDSNSKSYFFF